MLSKGCSKCHAGLGRLPSETQSADQLENIDCLICHAKGYQRDLYSDAAGGLEWKPILWRNQEGLDSVSKRVGRPQRAMCLRCHSASGGGPNFKRGDLEYKLADADRNYDVHMGTDGANLQCVDCHARRDHRMRGRGSDVSGTDAPAQPLSCGTAECHGPRPHAAEVLNQHATRVDCSVCHIPRFAREEPTDMARDWSQPHYDVEGDRYTATITFEKDVRPVYAWFNGMTRATLPGEPALRLPDGRIGMMIPEGSRKDSKARLHAFKLHKGKLPVLADRGWIVPIVVEHFFADGNIDAAVRKAAEETYGLKQPAYIWRDTLRYMGIYHGVQPAAKALACLDCHGARPVVDWKGLGYGVDPMLVRLAPPLPRRATSSKTR